jgi:N-acyl-D-amino-acid deacylase
MSVRDFPSAVAHFIKRHFWLVASLLFICLVVLVLFVWQSNRPPFDVIIKNGRVFDGEKFLSFPADVGIRNGRIAAVGLLTGVRATQVIDARGRVVAPGFIDTHVHVEGNMVLGRPFRAPNFLKMGVTTVVTGNCGTSHPRLREILDSLARTGAQVNIMTLVGHNTIREQVMGQSPMHPSPEQLQAMEAKVEDAMEAGAFGLSTGLEYAPGVYADKSEVIALARVAGNYGGIYATHVRDEGNGLMDSLEEAVTIAEQARIPLHISHLKRASKRDWGKMPEALAYLDSQRPNLPALTHDVYAYTSSSSSIDLLLPPEFRGTEGRSRMILRDPQRRKRLVERMLEQLGSNGFTNFRFAQIAGFRDRRFAGKNVSGLDLPESWRKETAWVKDLIADRPLAEEVQNVLYLYSHGGAQMIYAVMDESDMIAALKDPNASIGSDTRVWTPDMTTSHPRSIGNFPRILGELVRAHKIRLDEALRKMTLAPATIFGLSDRGRIKEGMAADLVIFDPDTVSGPADYNDLQEPRGIDYVLVNGTIVARYGRVFDKFPGTVIRKQNEGPVDFELPVPAKHRPTTVDSQQ